MMDIRPPDSKRMRADPSSWPMNDSQGPRPFGGHPYPQATLPRPQHRPTEVQQHYEADARRLSQPTLYDPYGAPGPRDPSIKPDPNERPPLPNSRPHSTGHINEGRPKPVPGDPRVQGMAAYEHPPGPPQGQSHFIQPPLPQSPLHPPPPNQFNFEVNMYDQNAPDRAQEPIYAEYTGVASSSQKKRTPRTSQACEACRNAKAKCTDPKPCQGCQEKGIPCKYDPPAPKQTDRIQSDILSRLDELMSSMDQMRHDIDESRKRETRTRNQLKMALAAAAPNLAKIFDQSDDELEGMKEEVDDFDHDMKRPAKRRMVGLNGVQHRAQPNLPLEGEANDSDYVSDSEITTTVPPGEPAIPIGHTTGAAGILRWPAVAHMVGDLMKRDKNRGMDPLRREIRRGVIKLYWRGEGVEKNVGDKDSVSDSSQEPPRSSSDTYSETAHSPAVGPTWVGRGSAASPVADTYQFLQRSESSEARTLIDFAGVPHLDEGTVRKLTGSYMRHLNVMHPIITQTSLEVMITDFLQQIGETTAPANSFANFVGSGNDTVGSKRKRSPIISSSEHPYAQHLTVGWRQRTISEALILIILALGKVCEWRHKIPDVVHNRDNSTTDSPSNPFSPQSMQSPQMTSRSSTQPSPTMADRARNRRASVDGSYAKYPPHTRNMDCIPGLAYFAIATDILGNYTGSTGLPYVHACLLAGLYHSQLGRVLQSHAFIKEAGYALTLMLKQHLARYKKMQEDMSDLRRHAKVKMYPEDNRILFTFWTCLQFESDIVAELEVPQSGILSLESIMPWPNLAMALENNEMTEKEMRCYSVQLIFRKKLNIIHRELYGPGKENEYQLADMNKLPSFPYIDTMIEDLNSVMNANVSLAWRDGDPPSSDILEARLRAKMYGAQVITYRHFLRMVLNNRYESTGVKNEDISKTIMDFAVKCIIAMFHSAQAFWGMGTKRLIVTNVWGTSHAQWGHVVVLHAAYMHPQLQRHVPAPELCELTRRVREFLESVSQPSSALADDIRILDYAIERSGAREEAARLGRPMIMGPTGTGMGPAVGAGSSFGSSGSDLSAPRI